ncbi:MAG TPA: phosphotransferase [Intrasporangium sp.]|uniref:phosphotransferase enzyme family protein n=1 Tax=Intrasporangium sp. TaxID=1925024 RepID=UPI002B4999AF|nr:phosphotransferase [Intrasporangium sp.]HKX69044.1 phosphotransferase [Intrasporangium sp.]
MDAARTYADLTDEEQAEALRPAAMDAAEAFGLEVHRLELVSHAFNSTFSLEAGDGRRLALRVNTNSTSSVAEVATQQQWLTAIAAETTVHVPRPVSTPRGEWYAQVESAALGRPVLVTCASWLEGPDVGDPDAEVARELGRSIALLHAHGTGWQLPPGGRLPRFDSPFFRDPDRLGSASGLTDDQHEVLRRARVATTEAFRRADAAGPVIPLHADLHGGNLKWQDGRLAVFDFDDCGLGVPALDLAISTFYLRGSDPATEPAMLSGYAEVSVLPDIAPADFEALVASRQLFLANLLLGSSTAQWRELAQTYLPLSVDRLRHWMRTGRFTRALPTT